MRNTCLKKNKKRFTGMSRTINYDPTSQAPIAVYFKSPSQIDANTEMQFEREYMLDNSYTWKDFLVFWIKKNKGWVILGTIVFVILLVILLIILL